MKGRLLRSIICGQMLATVIGSDVYAVIAGYNR